MRNTSAIRNTPTQKRLVSSLKKNLLRIEKLIRSPDVRPVDFATRDRFARRLQEARKLH